MSLHFFSQTAYLQRWVSDQKRLGHSVGFVPTMGALHAGHTSLVTRALEHCDKVVVSIFVNPTQFNDPKDLLHYPKTLPSDTDKLLNVNCHAVFVPTVAEVYPDGPVSEVWHVGAVKDLLEGAFRPGHFDGVLSVVKRLFDMVRPDIAFFGEKDYQQKLLIRLMAAQACPDVKIMSFPTIREEDGLAMSSRNVRLKADERSVSVLISKALNEMKNGRPEFSPEELVQKATTMLNAAPSVRIEYVTIADADTLESISSWPADNKPLRALIAAWVGNVRLIDNVEV
ncbi:MAG: hypothetical protein RL220_1754 [Bacteroidota bacterium]